MLVKFLALVHILGLNHTAFAVLKKRCRYFSALHTWVTGVTCGSSRRTMREKYLHPGATRHKQTPLVFGSMGLRRN